MIDIHMHTIYYDGDKTVEEIFSGKIIKGTELHAVFQNKSIEILAYNINPTIINEWCEKYYSEDKLK